MDDASEATPYSEPFQRLDSGNRGPWVIVACYILICLSSMAVFIRLVSKFKVTRVVDLNDGTIIASTFFAIVQTIFVTLAVNNGLGRHEADLTPTSIDRFNKYLYGADIVLLASLAFAKTSVTLFIVAIKPQRTVLLACYSTIGITVLYITVGIFVVAFQCRLPTPWLSAEGQCLDQYALQIALNILNIITDVAIVVLSVLLMWNVQVSQAKRWTVVGLFATRLAVPAFTVALMTQLQNFFHHTPSDQTWFAFSPAIWTQVMMNVSIITACAPSLKRFLADLQTGLMQIDVTQMDRKGSVMPNSATSRSPQRSGLGARIAEKLGGVRNTLSATRSPASSGKEDSNVDLESMKPRNPLSGGLTDSHSHENNYGGGVSRSHVERSDSVKGLTENVIMQTIDYRIEFEDGGDQRSERRSISRVDAASHTHSQSDRDAISTRDLAR